MSQTPVTDAKVAFTEFNVRQDRGKPHFIRLCDGVVERLEQDRALRKAEAFGVLVGTVDSDKNCTITVENFEPAEIVEEHILAWIPPKESSQIVVGYYRSNSGDGFTLDEADLALFERCFPKDARVALLVKSPKTSAGTATFFLGEDGKLDAERVTVEFPFDLRQLLGEEPPEAPPQTPATVSKAPRKSSFSKFLLTGAAVTASLVTLNGLGVFHRSPVIPDAKPAVVAQPVAATEFPETTPAASDIVMPAVPAPSTIQPTAAPAQPVTKPAAKVTPARQTNEIARGSIPELPKMLPAASDISALPVAAPAPSPVRPATAPKQPVARPAATVAPPRRNDDIAVVAPVKPPATFMPVEPVYTPPVAVRQFAPVLSEKLRSSIQGTVSVRVRVNVDVRGNVIAAEPAPGLQPAAEPFALAATAAVKRWQFEPASRGAEKIPGEIVLSFTFRK